LTRRGPALISIRPVGACAPTCPWRDACCAWNGSRQMGPGRDAADTTPSSRARPRRAGATAASTHGFGTERLMPAWETGSSSRSELRIRRSALRGRRRRGGRPRDRVGVMPQRGRAAPAMTQAGGGGAQVEPTGEELAGGVMPPALDVELHPGRVRCVGDPVRDPVRVPRPGVRRVVGKKVRVISQPGTGRRAG